MMALVCGGTLNSLAANLSTAVKGAASGTLNLRVHRTTHADQDEIWFEEEWGEEEEG